MNIIAVDDEHSALWTLEQALLKVAENATISCFASAGEALEYAEKTIVDVAFLDIEMDQISGLFLAKHLKDLNGKINIIFVTGHSHYVGNAFELRASGYVMKPINPSKVAEELANLRTPVTPLESGIYIQCFGNFEVFVDGIPVLFRRSKSKEALAYLVDRSGAGVTKKELASLLLEDKEYTRSIQSYIHVILSEMMLSLKSVGADKIVIKKRNLYAIDTSKVSCDFYNYENGNVTAVNSYHGEYMANYSWAEFRAGQLSQKNEYL